MSVKLPARSAKPPLADAVKSAEIRTSVASVRPARTADLRTEAGVSHHTGTDQIGAAAGRIIGAAERTAGARSLPAESPRNASDRFAPGGLSGFVFQNPHPIAYHACPGRTLFFTVEGITLS
jgi:hypothetical protein